MPIDHDGFSNITGETFFSNFRSVHLTARIKNIIYKFKDLFTRKQDFTRSWTSSLTSNYLEIK